MLGSLNGNIGQQKIPSNSPHQVMCYYMCACMERHLGKPSQSLEKRLLKIQTLQTPHLTHPTPLPLLLLHPHRGVARQCHFGVRAFNKARRSLDKLGWYSQDRSAGVPMVDVRENTHSLIYVYDTLSGKQAVDDRNSWATIRIIHQLPWCRILSWRLLDNISRRVSCSMRGASHVR